MKKHLVTLLASAIGATGLVGGSVSIKPAQPLPAYEKSVIWNDLILPKDYGWWDAFRVADLNADGRSDLAIVWGQTFFPVTEPLQIGIRLDGGWHIVFKRLYAALMFARPAGTAVTVTVRSPLRYSALALAGSTAFGKCTERKKSADLNSE